VHKQEFIIYGRFVCVDIKIECSTVIKKQSMTDVEENVKFMYLINTTNRNLAHK